MFRDYRYLDYELSFTELDREQPKWKRKDIRGLRKLSKLIDKELKKLFPTLRRDKKLGLL